MCSDNIMFFPNRKKIEFCKKFSNVIKSEDQNFTLNVLRSIEEETIEEDERIMSALQCSLDEAEERGIKKGRREGYKEGTQEVALRMIQNGCDVKTICLCTGLTSKEVKELRQKAKNIKF